LKDNIIKLEYTQGFEKMSQDKDNVNKLFRQFKNKYVTVDLRGGYQVEGKIIAIDNYLNLVLENDNGIETVKGGNIVFISLKED
jgi:small nuclear ribonucleoprotein (snRNP)-like protein